MVNEHGLGVLDFTLLEQAHPGQDLRELEQRYLDLHLPADQGRGFNNLPKTRGHAPAEPKLAIHLTPELVEQVNRLQPGSGISNKSTFLRTLLQGALHQLQTKRNGC